MGDIHIHAREDITGKETHKETFACVSAAALHGGVLHVADMPNNPAAPIDNASYAVKEALLQRQNLPVVFTLYAGIGPGTKPLSRAVPYKAYMGPSVGHLSLLVVLEQLEETLAATTPVRGCPFTAKIRFSSRSTRAPQSMKNAGRPNAS